MTEEPKRLLKVFLCHASGDKPAVRVLYQRLIRDGVDAWLDKEKLLPGQDWRQEIPRAVRESDVVVICLSNKSLTKEGYVQTEIAFALDIAKEKPEGTIFLIPARLEECDVPSKLGLWQWVDLFESDGYEWLMRSLRSRAEKLGVRLGDTIYTDDESAQRLEQLYTEGLAALWVDDWDKAVHRFQAILRDQPQHVRAAHKLDEAKRQRQLQVLYNQALDAQKAEDWDTTIAALEKSTKDASDYKDAMILLREAQKNKQLVDLYQDARRLHRAQQWRAVVRVFAQIHTIQPNYQDPDGLLASAEKQVVELKRLAELNELYSRSVREMDDGNWYEARKLLEQVHKAQTGFLETEPLLRKVEKEIAKIEEREKVNIQINTLYEQAHGLVRSENWHEALNKIEEIQKLDSQFVDREGIFEKVRAGLEREEEIIRRQNELAAMYAEAVRLLKEGKYQEALDKWQEIKATDPKYPDRQSVQRTAQKKLVMRTSRIGNLKQVGIISLLAITLVGIVWFSSQHSTEPPVSITPSILPPTILPTPFISPTPLAYWQFINDSEGWSSNSHDISFDAFEQDFIAFKTTGQDPYISSAHVKIAAATASMITVQMSLTQTNSSKGAIYFTTDKDSNFDERKKQSFPLHDGAGQFKYDIDMSRISTWQGVITQLRLDPVDDPSPSSYVEIEIYYIWVH